MRKGIRYRKPPQVYGCGERCCSVFGCGQLLTDREKLFGNKCINHSNEIQHIYREIPNRQEVAKQASDLGAILRKDKGDPQNRGNG